MKLFKSIANWFFSDERENIKQIIKEEISSLKETITPVEKHPISSARLVGKELIVVLYDGSILTKSDASDDDFSTIKQAKTVAEVIKVIEHKQIQDRDEEDVFSEYGILKNHPDFVLNPATKKVYFKDIDLAIPNVIVASFVEILEKKASNKYDNEDLNQSYEALVMFWLKLAMNPIESSREDILTFIKKNSVHITKYGNMVLYRRIVSRQKAKENKEYFKMISTAYSSVKKNRKSPRNYIVYKENNTYKFIKNTSTKIDKDKIVGNLYDLYQALEKHDSNDYTAAHDKKVNIKIGGIYSIPEDKINMDNGLCAAGGLHAAAVDYNYSGFGDTPVVVLVSPSKAITVPKNETGKLRTTEMFIVCVNNKPHGVHFDENGIFQFDEKYHSFTLEQLEQDIKTKSFTNTSIKNEVPQLKIMDLKAIQEQLKKRIVKI